MDSSTGAAGEKVANHPRKSSFHNRVHIWVKPFHWLTQLLLPPHSGMVFGFTSAWHSYLKRCSGVEVSKKHKQWFPWDILLSHFSPLPQNWCLKWTTNFPYSLVIFTKHYSFHYCFLNLFLLWVSSVIFWIFLYSCICFPIIISMSWGKTRELKWDPKS